MSYGLRSSLRSRTPAGAINFQERKHPAFPPPSPKQQSKMKLGAVSTAMLYFLLSACIIASGRLWWELRYTQEILAGLTRDAIALPDLAWRYNGAQVVPSLTTRPSNNRLSTNPYMAIDDDLHPGSCWAFSGKHGQLGVLFPSQLKITHITVDHLPKEIALRISNAPRHIHVWGFTGVMSEVELRGFANKAPPIRDPKRIFVQLASFEYDIAKPNNIQTFPIASTADPKASFEGMVVEILDNWGSESTCLY